MRGLKIVLILVFVAALVYCGAALVIALGAVSKQAELEQHLVRLTRMGQDQLAELAGHTEAMQPVVQACRDLPAVAAEEVVQYLGPPPESEPAAGDQALSTRFDSITGVRDGSLVSRLASDAAQPTGLSGRFFSVLASPPWRWGRLSRGPVGQDPPVERARYLVVARPTLLAQPAPGGSRSLAGSLVVMQVAVLDAASGELKCRGGLAGQVGERLPARARAEAVELFALRHLCALGGIELCQAIERRVSGG